MQPKFEDGNLVVASAKNSTIFATPNYLDQLVFPSIFGDPDASAQFLLDFVKAKAFVTRKRYKLDEYFLSTLSEPVKLANKILKGKYISPRGEFNQQTIDFIFAIRKNENEDEDE